MLAEARAHLTHLAHDLADAVDAAVRADATSAWLEDRRYLTAATTWPTDLIPVLDRHGLTRLNTTHVSVRDVLVRTTTTCLEEN